MARKFGDGVDSGVIPGSHVHFHFRVHFHFHFHIHSNSNSPANFHLHLHSSPEIACNRVNVLLVIYE